MNPIPVVSRDRRLIFGLLTCCFAAWGLANNMTDTLLAAFKRIQSMSDLQTSFIQVAFYGAYFCLALPAAILIRRWGYKAGVLLGLGFFSIGGLLFYPSSLTMEYAHFLAALFVLAGGLSILETAANPYIYVLGDERTATQRLNLAAAFNPFGAISGVVISKIFILSQLREFDATARAALPADELVALQREELAAVMGPYVTVSLLLVILFVALTMCRFPQGFDEKATQAEGDDGVFAAIGRLLRNRHYVFGVIAQFFYVGAQIGVWSFSIQYVMAELGVNEAAASNYYIAALVLYAFSRFVCTGLMSFFRPSRVLLGTALLGCAFAGVTAGVGGMVGAITLVGISGCMSLMFPTIYGVALNGVGRDTKVGGCGLIMAILGGAVLTAVQARVSDYTASVRLAYLVPLVCFGVVAIYAFVSGRVPKANTTTGAAQP